MFCNVIIKITLEIFSRMHNVDYSFEIDVFLVIVSCIFTFFLCMSHNFSDFMPQYKNLSFFIAILSFVLFFIFLSGEGKDLFRLYMGNKSFNLLIVIYYEFEQI